MLPAYNFTEKLFHFGRRFTCIFIMVHQQLSPGPAISGVRVLSYLIMNMDLSDYVYYTRLPLLIVSFEQLILT